jgi:hypothetical protein
VERSAVLAFTLAGLASDAQVRGKIAQSERTQRARVLEGFSAKAEPGPAATLNVSAALPFVIAT